jgi:hypothetical protein
MSRCLAKPRGYAGDYQMMNYLYDDDVLGEKSNMGKFLDYFLFSNPAVNAVRNRAKVIQGVVQYRLAGQSELRVASIACGPAREVAGTIQMIASNAGQSKIIWTLLDQDKEAIDNARKNVPVHISLEPKFINAGVRDIFKRNVSLGKQDIIYTLGLFDYLEDKVAISLIKILYDELNAGGLLLIGNYHPCNPLRTLIEGVMDWYLIYRTEEEMMTLARAAVPDGRHFVMAEPEGINLILVTSKPLSSNN